ncbi:MAG TPA: hypothetical protein VGD66_08085 [Allosphingosinicella sp.]
MAVAVGGAVAVLLLPPFALIAWRRWRHARARYLHHRHQRHRRRGG